MARGGATFLINYEKRDMGSLNSKVSDERMVCGKEILPEWFADRMTALLFHSGSAKKPSRGRPEFRFLFHIVVASYKTKVPFCPPWHGLQPLSQCSSLPLDRRPAGPKSVGPNVRVVRIHLDI